MSGFLRQPVARAHLRCSCVSQEPRQGGFQQNGVLENPVSRPSRPKSAPGYGLRCAFQRTPWGVEKRRGVENLTNDTPPKKGFWTAPRTVRFLPPQVSVLYFPVQKSTTEQTRISFGGVQKFSRERVLWYVFAPPPPPPYVLYPPTSQPKHLALREPQPKQLQTPVKTPF